MLLSKDEILNAHDFNYEDVEVPEWGGSVRLRVMTAAQRNAFQAQMVVMDGTKIKSINMADLQVKLLALCLVDENFEPLFTAKDLAELGKKSGIVIDRLFSVAQRINGLDEDAVERAAVNFQPIPNGDSISS